MIKPRQAAQRTAGWMHSWISRSHAGGSNLIAEDDATGVGQLLGDVGAHQLAQSDAAMWKEVSLGCSAKHHAQERQVTQL